MKTVKISEKSYDKLKKNIVNEISYGTVDRACDRQYDLFFDVSSKFDEFYCALQDALLTIKYDSEDGQQKSNPYLNEIERHADIIEKILNKKKVQRDKFFDATTRKINHEKFFNSDEAKENSIDDMDIYYLHKNYPKTDKNGEV